MTDVIIIGAGASGLMAAVSAARFGASVLVLEKQSKPGQKLLMTGNGRCNLTHLDPDIAAAYHSEDPESLQHITASLFTEFSVEKTIQQFESMGIYCHNRDGYVYPRADQASAVLQALLDECRRLKVKIKLNCEVTGVKQHRAQNDLCWDVLVEGWKYTSRCVIMAGGSLAGLARNTGNSRTLLQAAADLGHTIVSVVPALTGLEIPLPALKTAQGARTEAAVTLQLPDGRRFPTEKGQIQWNASGISGICVMQLSRHVSRWYSDRNELSFTDMTADKTAAVPKVIVDFVRDLTERELHGAVSAHLPETGLVDCTDAQLIRLFTGFVPDRIAAMLTELFRQLPVSQQTIAELVRLLKELSLPVAGVRDLSAAQVCAGGISLSEVDPETFQSVKCSGLYAAGELLDADGPCGGYNLQWAWSTGMAAGIAAAGHAAGMEYIYD